MINLQQTLSIDFSNIQRSVEQVMVSGGDSRMSLDPLTGMNEYGCKPKSRNSVTPFGSCTSSSPSIGAMSTATRTLEKILLNPQFYQSIDEANEEIRQDLLTTLTKNLVPKADVILTPSGTDAEIITTLLALSTTNKKLCNIIMGANEVGKGSILAAGGRFFDSRIPDGSYMEKGKCIEKEISKRIEVTDIVLRDYNHTKKSSARLDQEVFDTIESSVQNDYFVLLHMVVHSKTGIYENRLSSIKKYKNIFKEKLFIVIDSAQMRLSRDRLVEFLNLGFYVIITGSKFFGGPPFSGAILIPAESNYDINIFDSFNNAYRNFIGAAEVPKSWTTTRSILPKSTNIGLTLRWSAALYEIHQYYDIQKKVRSRIFKHFEKSVFSVFSKSPHIVLLKPTPMKMNDQNMRDAIELFTTVFSFRLFNRKQNRFYNYEELQKIARLMNRNSSNSETDESTNDVLSNRFHIGQPTHIGPQTEEQPAVLRIAIGAPLVNLIATNTDYGDTIEERLKWLENQIELMKLKLDAIVNNYFKLTRGKIISTNQN